MTGTGQVLFGPAEDAEGNKVVDADGKEILYPRVGQDNGSQDDLPVKLDQDGVPLYDETQRISQVDETGTERGIFRSFTTLREVLIHGKLEKAKAEIKAKGADTIPKDKAKDLATVL